MFPSTAYPTLDPKDLVFLQKFYDDARAQRGVDGNSPDAEDLAARIILSYQKGARTEVDLARAL